MWTGGVGVQIEGTVDRIKRYRNNGTRNERGENRSPWRLLIGRRLAHWMKDWAASAAGRLAVQFAAVSATRKRGRKQTKTMNQPHMDEVTAVKIGLYLRSGAAAIGAGGSALGGVAGDEVRCSVNLKAISRLRQRSSGTLQRTKQVTFVCKIMSHIVYEVGPACTSIWSQKMMKDHRTRIPIPGDTGGEDIRGPILSNGSFKF